jgi:hypothetical protein
MKKSKFTVWITQSSGFGTHFVTCVDAGCARVAKMLAIEECLENWGENFTEEDLHVLGVVAGDVTIVEWNDSIYEK